MTTRVDFYLLNNPSTENCGLVACQIIDKAYQQGQQTYVLCTDEAQAKHMDKLLWTFRDISFLPHALQDQHASAQDAFPILIGYLSQPHHTSNYGVLINLSSVFPAHFSSFSRVIEVISSEVDQRTKARERYKSYKQHNCEMHSHQLG